MQRNATLTIFFIMIGLFFTACSGKKNPQPDNQQKHPSSVQRKELTAGQQPENKAESAIPDRPALKQSQGKHKSTGIFTFQINGKKYTATTVNPSMYEQVSDTSSILGMIATYRKPDHSTMVISLNLELKKEGLKPGTYTLGDASKDATPYKGSYMKKTTEGLMYMGYSKKGAVTITHHHNAKGSAHSMDFGDQRVSSSEGKISGHFTFTGKVVLTTTMADNPPEKTFMAKGTFHNISLQETRSLAGK